MDDQLLVKRNYWIQAVFFVAIFIAIDLLSREGVSVADTSAYDLAFRAFGNIGLTITILLVLRKLYRRFLWRIDPMIGIPVLKRHCAGTISYKNDFGGIEHKDVQIVIDQEINRVKMRLYSPDSQSETLIGRFEIEKDGPVLYYVYRTNALTIDYPGERVNLGAASLSENINGDLEGPYWTSAGRTGRLCLYQVRRLSSLEKTRAVPKSDNVKNVAREDGFQKAYLNSLVSALRSVSARQIPGFSGLGVIVCGKGFDGKNLVPLRQNVGVPRINIFTESGQDYLARVATKSCNLHDGFICITEAGDIEKIAQYLHAPRTLGAIPNVSRGTRSYSALCGSSLSGVKAIGIISEDRSIAIYRRGNCIYDSKEASRVEGSFPVDS